MTGVAIVLLLLAVLENLWPLIAGYAATPKGSVFLGTIHYAPDYLYYLSQFAQGRFRTFTTLDLYTPERVDPSIVGWPNVLLGRIGWMLRLPPETVYGVSVIALTLLTLYTAYLLIREMTRGPKEAAAAFFLFIIFHAFPVPNSASGPAGFPFTYSDYWDNIAVPFVRLGGVPHQLLTALASFVLMRSALRFLATHRKRELLSLGISSVILGSLQPVLWLVSVIALSLTVSVPVLLAAAAGSIPVLYLVALFRYEPFIQLKAWEAAQHVSLTLPHFLLATGPVFIAGVAAAIVYGRRWLRHPKTRLMLAIPLLGFGLFLSPASYILHITEVRFLSALTVLCTAAAAARGLSGLPRTVRYGLLILIAALLVPSHLVSLQLYSRFAPSNAYQYLSARDYAFLKRVGNLESGQQGTYLLIWPYNMIFPALTGKRSFNGHPLLTIDSMKKDAAASRFFDGTMTPSDMVSLLQTYDVTYVVSYTWTPKLSSLPFLTPVSVSENLIVYRVRLANGL